MGRAVWAGYLGCQVVSMTMLPLLSLLPLAASDLTATVPKAKDFPFKGVKDPCKQCLDITCYDSVDWKENKLEVCRYKKKWNCVKRKEEVCRNIPKEECQVVGYVQCKNEASDITVRDDEVVSEYFKEWDCKHQPITLLEKKEHPHCKNQTKRVCEKMWIPEAPFWKDVNCQELEWQNCTLIEKPHPVIIDYCPCEPAETWYDKLVPQSTVVRAHSTVCTPDPVVECATSTERSCAVVEWEDCVEEVEKECHMQHFRIPSQPKDHRRWCSHVEIPIPAGIPRIPDPVGVDTCPSQPGHTQTGVPVDLRDAVLQGFQLGNNRKGRQPAGSDLA